MAHSWVTSHAHSAVPSEMAATEATMMAAATTTTAPSSCDEWSSQCRCSKATQEKYKF
jgi:hypothetical protein